MTEEINPELRVNFLEFLSITFFAICDPPKIAHAKPIKTSGAS
jgi:hypothetical protein